MQNLFIQTHRFALVGIIATLVHFLVIVLLVDLLKLVSPTPATVIGSVFGIATAYLGNYHFVFGISDKQHTRYIPRFVATYIIVMAIHAGVMYLFTESWNLNYEYGFVVATFFSAVSTFLANRYLVFNSADNQPCGTEP